jgi:hypothetical protein
MVSSSQKETRGRSKAFLNPNLTPDRLVQEPLTRDQHLIIKLKLILPHDRRNYQHDLHLRHIPTGTLPRTNPPRHESFLLRFCNGVPSFCHEVVGILAPDFLTMVDRPCWDTENYSSGKEFAAYCDAVPVGWDDARETKRIGGVYAEGFVDYS